MRLKIFDTRALQHPKPLEIMSKALKIARCGEILLMIHRREPFPLYEIIKAQGLEFRAFESDFCGGFEVNSVDENLQNFSEFLQSNLLSNFGENSLLNSALKSTQNKDFSIEFALFNEDDENDNSVNFTRNFYFKNQNFVANSMKNLSENLVKKMSKNSQNSSQNSHEKTFFIFIAQKQILKEFDSQNFIKKFTQISSDFNAKKSTQIFTQNSAEKSEKFRKNSAFNAENSANSNKKFAKERQG